METFALHDIVEFEDFGTGKGEVVGVLEQNKYDILIISSGYPEYEGKIITMHAEFNRLKKG